jgi:hypothetical protein
MDQNFEKFKGKQLHLDNYVIKKVGIIGNQTILRINDFHLNCIPYDLALKSCNVLMILDTREIDFFKQSFQKVHSIHFVFQNALYKKPIPLFLRCKIINLKVMNSETNHCMVTLAYTVIPNDYKEILINIFKRNEALEFLYNSDQFRTKEVQRNELKSAYLEDTMHLRSEKGSEPISMIIISTTMTIIKIIGVNPDSHYNVNDRVQVELFSKDNSFFINGTVVTIKDSLEIPEYKIMEIKLEFSSYITDFLYLYLKKKSEPVS